MRGRCTHAWPPSTSVAFVRVNGHLPPLSSHADIEVLSLGPSGVLKGLSVCLLLEGIVSLSLLSHQVAALNGHRIKATSLGKRVHTHIYRGAETQHTFSCAHTPTPTPTHTHTHTQPISWQDLFTLETVTLSLGKAGVKPSCLVQRDTRRQTSTVRPKDFYLLWSITD